MLGALLGSILPAGLVSALSVALYAMFLAIILPPAKKEKPVRAVVLMAVAMSCLITLLPLLSFISDGFRIILCAVAASALGAWLMPQPVKDDEEEAA